MGARGVARSAGRKGGASKQKPQQVRIIGGQWKRSILPVMDAEGLRPTPDRVRETVFNWITHQLGSGWTTTRCLDLFAGSGALGFEAASRGAAETVLVEWHPSVVRQLRSIKEKLQAESVQVVQGDALGVAERMAANEQQFDLIFLDPPYRQGWLPRVLPICEHLLKAHGIVYVESADALGGVEDENSLGWLKKWEIIRQDKAGAVFYYLLRMVK